MHPRLSMCFFFRNQPAVWKTFCGERHEIPPCPSLQGQPDPLPAQLPVPAASPTFWTVSATSE